jgi:hypothetical protein
LKTNNGAQRYFVVSVVVGVIALMWTVSESTLRRPGMGTLVYLVAVLSMLGGGLAVIAINNDKWHSSLQSETAFFAPLIGKDPIPFPKYIEGLDALVSKLDQELAKGEYVAMDSRGGFGLLYSRYPKQFIVPEDRDFDEIMSDAEGRFRYVLITTGGLTSQYSADIEAAMGSTVKGKFVLFDETETIQLWKYEPNPGTESSGPLRPGR